MHPVLAPAWHWISKHTEAAGTCAHPRQRDCRDVSVPDPAVRFKFECLSRLANHLAADVGKLGFRGTICNNEAKWEHAKVGHAPPIWFVFSGERPLPLMPYALACPDINVL